MDGRSQLKWFIGVSLIIVGAVLAMHGSNCYSPSILQWENTSVADNYEVRLSTGGGSLVHGFPDNTTDNFYPITSELAVGRYNWKVRAYKDENVSDLKRSDVYVTPPVTRDISPLPLSLGLTVLFISLFAEFGRRVGRRRPLGSEGISYGIWKILAILFVFAVTLIIIGVIIPLMWG